MEKQKQCCVCGKPIVWKCENPECQKAFDKIAGYRRGRKAARDEARERERQIRERRILQIMEEAKARSRSPLAFANPEDDDWF